MYHLPPGSDGSDFHDYHTGSTLQIGDPSMIANLCEVTTVGDFRTADMAVGGQGAPLVPYFDGILLNKHFRRTGRVGMILNIGGISNIAAYIPGKCYVYFFEHINNNALVCILRQRWILQHDWF